MLTQTGHSLSTDLYSLGAILYEMVTGLPPHYSLNRDEMYENIVYTNISYPRGLRPTLKFFLSSLLRKDPEKRIGQEGMEEIKSHPWCKDIDWSAVKGRRKKPPFSPNLRRCNFETEFLQAKYSGLNSEIGGESGSSEELGVLMACPLNSMEGSVVDKGSVIMGGMSYLAGELELGELVGKGGELPTGRRIARVSDTSTQPESTFTSFLEVPLEGEKKRPKNSPTRGAAHFPQYLGCPLPGLPLTPHLPISHDLRSSTIISSFTLSPFDDSLVPIEHTSSLNPSVIIIPTMQTETFSSLATQSTSLKPSTLASLPHLGQHITQNDIHNKMKFRLNAKLTNFNTQSTSETIRLSTPDPHDPQSPFADA